MSCTYSILKFSELQWVYLKTSFLPQRSILELLSSCRLQLKSGQQGLTNISQCLELSSLGKVNLARTKLTLFEFSAIINIKIQLFNKICTITVSHDQYSIIFIKDSFVQEQLNLYQYLMGIRKGLLLLLLSLISSCQIVSRPIQASFTSFGAFQSFQISCKPLNDICATCLLELTFPQLIHLGWTALTYDIIDEKGVCYVQKGASVPPTSAVYYFPVNQLLFANIWYIITIQPTKPPLMVYGVVGIRVVAGIASSNIAYLTNSAFQYYHLEAASLPPSNLVLTPISTAIPQAGQMYPYEISFSSNVAYCEQVMLTFFFTNQLYSALTPSTPPLQNNNFKFVGSCRLICSNPSCILPLSCSIQNNQLQLLLPKLPSLTAYTLQFTILNPSFVDSTGMAVEVQGNNAVVSGVAIINNLFTVTPISIISSDVNLHWGIPLSVVQGAMGLGLFVDGGWNTIDIGFFVSQITMIGIQFSVQLYVGASSVLQQSISTNLPSLKGTSNMRCFYVNPYVKCTPVDAFTSIALRHYIKFKAYIASADNIANIGSISISILNSPNVLFNDLIQNLSITKIAYSDYHDYSGFHSSSYRIKQTQVIGTPDSGLANSTSTFMNTLFTSNSSFVGIDPSVGRQQLIFLLKTTPTQMSLALANQAYEMKVYINPQVFASIGTDGIDIAAYDQGTASYRGDAVSCYINSSTSPTIQIYQCQTYKDYVYGSQVDNKYTNAGHYGVFSFTCGSGSVVVCPTGQSCNQTCRIFKGKGATSGSSGVFSIRNVLFAAGYQSSYLADEKTLDFMVAFYHGGALVSASLINAYTIRQARLSYLSLNFYNTYLSATATNDGARVPTLLSLTGNLSVPEINATNYDQFLLFLPQEATVNKYLEGSGRVGCSHSCISHNYLNSMTTCQDNWICKQKISIRGIINIDSSISFTIPIQITTTLIGSFNIALLSANTIVKVYRIGGSAITDAISVLPMPSVAVTAYANPWVSSSYWVKTAANVYRQGLNLNTISQFSSANTIDMQASTLTYSGHPCLTFTSLSFSLFTEYTTAYANNVYQCSQPFYYTYQSLYNITVLLCQLLNGAINQVTINYPFYSATLGAGFPFQNVFAYGLSDSLGNLFAYRTESNSKTVKDVCSTAHLNIFNYADVVPQLLDFSLSINPVTISSTAYPTIQIIITFPNQIPVNYMKCAVTQALSNQKIVCAITSSAANVGTLQLSSASPLTVMSLRANVWLTVSGAVSVMALSSYYYSINIRLPQTDSSNNAAILGTLYSPFLSDVATCSSTVSLVNLPALNQPILINDISSTAISLGYLADLSFTVKFSLTRPNIIASSEIDIQFTNALTTPTTTCTLWNPQNYTFLQQFVISNGVRLKPLPYDTAFSLISYVVTCKNVLIQQNSITIAAQWIDGANILQKSTATPYVLNLPLSVTVAGSLFSKNVNTLGFDSTYKFSLSVSTVLNDKVQIWVDLGNHHIHDMVLQCYYLSNSLNTQVYCIHDWQGKVHITFPAVAGSVIDFSIYGIRQNSASAINHRVLVSINSLKYYAATITDASPPNVVTLAPVIIKTETIDLNYCISLVISFPVAYSASFYLQVDDTFISALPTTFLCTVDGLPQICSRYSPNVILLSSTFAFSIGIDHTISVCKMKPTKLDIQDSNQIHFKLFAISGSQVSIASYQILLSPYYLSNFPNFPVQNLIWSEHSYNSSWLYHTIYMGYYKTPVFLSIFNQSMYVQNIALSSTSFNSYTYSNETNNVLMGTQSCLVDIAYNAWNAANMIDYLTVTHASNLYEQPPPLPLFISSDKCIISPEYTLYETYPGGITLPILLDFSNCRPAATHFFTYSITSSELIADSSLSNFKVNSTFPQVYIFVRQMPTNPTLSTTFTLNIQFSGPFNTSFVVTPSISIRINSGTILQIPQSLPPVSNYQNNSFINLTLQCNQPSTIYWALGFYPTIMGITYEMIQGQLINGHEGMRRRVYDPYSWSKQTYGIDYEQYSNKNKTLIIDNLYPNSNYLFKYFCVNQLGFASGGQLINFTTGSTDYELNKVQLKLPKMLTIYQANLIACYISEVLLTPYSTVTTSTFSNCFNNSFTFYPTTHTTYYDYKNGSFYSYFFYIDSRSVITPNILSILPPNLPTYNNYIKNIPPYSSISISPLLNTYDPIVVSSSFSVCSSVVTCTINVGVVASYLILAYMSQVFNPLNMSLPAHQLIKQGNFSTISQFNRVYMKYGNNNITANITGLLQYKNYSIFYFVTVDNPATNSKPTKVYYYNIQTAAFVTYDLSANNLAVIIHAIFLVLAFLI